MGVGALITGGLLASQAYSSHKAQKEAKKQERELQKTLTAQQDEERKKQEKEKEKQRQTYKNFYETSRYNSLGLLKEKENQIIG